jgi:hypothetical protein
MTRSDREDLVEALRLFVPKAMEITGSSWEDVLKTIRHATYRLAPPVEGVEEPWHADVEIRADQPDAVGV